MGRRTEGKAIKFAATKANPESVFSSVVSSKITNCFHVLNWDLDLLPSMF